MAASDPTPLSPMVDDDKPKDLHHSTFSLDFLTGYLLPSANCL